MSARHTRDPELDGGLMAGHALVPGHGWVRSTQPGGRHRRLECHIDLCRDRSQGDCPAMADGLCVGGTWTGRCHG